MRAFLIGLVAISTLGVGAVRAEVEPAKAVQGFDPIADCQVPTEYARERLDEVLTLLDYKGPPIKLCRNGRVPGTAAWVKLVGYEKHPYINWKKTPVVDLYVVYNPTTMQSMEAAVPRRHLVTAMFAHEVGHLMRQHVEHDQPFMAYGEPWQFEVEADAFVGFALARQQTKLADLQQVMMTLFTLWSDLGHGGAEARLKSLLAGWSDGGGTPVAVETLDALRRLSMAEGHW